MYVITADQVGSRTDRDRASELIERVAAGHGEDLLLPPDQTAGDEVQLLTASPRSALALVLEAGRGGHWSVGLGVGAVRSPLPDAVRKASGPAFVAAREAVEAAKRADGRVALRSGSPDAAEQASRVEALLRLLVLLRERRSDAGWEVADLLGDGHRQKDVAAILDVSPAAVSARLKTALWRAEQDAIPALEALLADLDEASARPSDDA